MAIVLYARKSVERENSISCETQLEYCRMMIKPDERSERQLLRRLRLVLAEILRPRRETDGRGNRSTNTMFKLQGTKQEEMNQQSNT